MKNPWKKVELIVYLNQDETSRIEYKGRVIQTYGYQVLILEIMKISERIGSNGNKVQRLRTMIKQEMSF